MQSKGTSIFSQMLQLFNRNDFSSAVRQFHGDKGAKGFRCWDQFVAMLFCHLAKAQSLREISGGLKSCLGKLSHLGIRQAPKRSTLAYANEHRDWRIYQTVFFQLLERVQSQWNGKRKFKFKNKLFSIDATTIDLCLSMFDWAKFRRAKGAIKLHLILDHDGYLPNFAHITDGKQHEVKVLKNELIVDFSFPKDSIIVFDRAYNDYKLFSHWTTTGVFFVTRMKDNADYRVVKRRPVPDRGNVLKDQDIRLKGFYSKEKCPHLLRRIEVVDPESGEILVFLTNHMKFAASTVAEIYKDRWEIEIFFKTIKQHLKIKTFVGTSSNAVKVQIWTALIAILLLKYLKMTSQYLGWSLSNLIALLRFNLFSYRDLYEWLNNPYAGPPDIIQEIQLVLPGIGQQTVNPGFRV
jgi:hypothetical protein